MGVCCILKFALLVKGGDFSDSEEIDPGESSKGTTKRRRAREISGRQLAIKVNRRKEKAQASPERCAIPEDKN